MSLSALRVLAFLSFLISSSRVHADLSRVLARDGLVEGVTGYPGTVYQAIRYEPLCGTLGDDSAYGGSFSYGDLCGHLVMDVYSNTTDTFAIYDNSGIRLAGAIIGGGLDLCMCFSLRTSGGVASDMCWWISGDGQESLWASYTIGSFIAGSYRPGSAKSLPHCSDINLTAAQATWSATAATRIVNETTRSLGTQTNTVTNTETITFTPSGKF